MGHLPSAALTQFERGKPLAAKDLNDNFLTLLALLEAVALEARLPDPTVVALEANLARLEHRVEALEHLTAMHARQRNEREWAPLSHLGAVIIMVNDLRRDMERAVFKLDAIHAELQAERGEHARRLQRLEQQPEYATADEVRPLAADHARLALKEHMLLAQIIALRHEMGLLREMQMGQDRLKNRTEYAPLSYIGHILQRLQAIEARLP